MTEPLQRRASREDRDAVAAMLGQELKNERLRPHEYDDRLFRTYEAERLSDLEPLVTDLLPERMPFESWLTAARAGELEARTDTQTAAPAPRVANTPTLPNRRAARIAFSLAVLFWMGDIVLSIATDNPLMIVAWLLGALYAIAFRLGQDKSRRQ